MINGKQGTERARERESERAREEKTERGRGNRKKERKNKRIGENTSNTVRIISYLICDD
jgi:hypothetical protein